MQTSTFSQFAATSSVDKSGIIRGVSLITGNVECIGHDMFTDATTLQQALAVAKGFGKIKVKLNHDTGLEAVVGYLQNFRIEGDKLKGDLNLLPSHPQVNFIRDLIATQADQFGLSLTFSRGLEEKGKKKYVRVLDILSCDLVDRPAANPGGLFSEGSGAKPITFQSLVADAVATGLSKTTAIEQAVRSNPEAYNQWRASGQTDRLELTPSPKFADFKTLVGLQIGAGKTKGQAVEFCVKNFPERYTAWLRSGQTHTL